MHARLASLLALSCLFAVSFGLADASASHSWGNYHWARTANPFTVPLGDSLTSTSASNWDAHLPIASADWNASRVLDSPIVASGANPRRCRATNGRIEVCNASYGFNGWLGVAQIWVKGVHIVKASTKLNDSYFSSIAYTETNEQHVLCQEIGHGYGLDHQDESGADLNTCMDYSEALDNPHPNAHDYEQLETIYAHFDSTSTVGTTTATSGRVIHRRDGLRSSYTVEDLGRGFRLHTHIFWAVPGIS
jgi:hypothetical protein